MSGLAVLFYRDGRSAEPDAIGAMIDAVPHRGPDGVETQLIGAVGLGYAKLATTPEEATGRQPFTSARTGCVVIADARLDNRDDLLARLPDHPSSAASDAEIILRAYEAWGVDVAVHLLGDFAFVIWD
ncbi:MAG: asparagine synthetase B, partial [Chloroflexota bacterium]